MNQILTEADLLDIRESARHSYGSAIETPRVYRLGRILGENSVQVEVPDPEVPGMLWIRSTGDAPGDAIPAINKGLSKDQRIAGTYVEVKSGGRFPVILGIAEENAYFTEGAADQAYTIIEQHQLLYGLLHPTTPASMQCVLSAAARWTGTEVIWNEAMFTKDFAADVPGSNAIAVFVEIDPATDTLYYTNSSSFSAESSLRAVFMTTLPRTVASGRFPVGYVKLAAGMTEIKTQDILPVRGLIAQGGGGSSDPFANALYLFPGEYIYLSDGSLVVIPGS